MLKGIGENIIKIGQKYATPFYLYNGDELNHHLSKFRNDIDPSINIFFSLKANNNIALLSMIRKLGYGVEIASKGELMLAKLAGYYPKDIIYSGPGKTMEELREVIELNILCINIESIEELKIIEKLGREHNKRVNIAVRINPDKDVVKSIIKMAGVPRQFGIDESQLNEFFIELRKCDHLNFLGIHVYTGTQVLDSDQILESFTYTLKLAQEIQRRYFVKIKMIDLGGGFGVPYFSHEQMLDMNDLSRRINNLIQQSLVTFPKTKFIIESGRYLIAKSGYYVCKVLYTKSSKGEKFVIVDGGMHHHAAATFRGRNMRNNFPILLIKKDGREEMGTEKVNIAGVLCTPDDLLAKNVELPIVEPGDYIVILNSGAYGLSYSPIQFLGHPTPTELLLLEDQVHIIRERGKDDDLQRYQKFIKI